MINAQKFLDFNFYTYGILYWKKFHYKTKLLSIQILYYANKKYLFVQRGTSAPLLQQAP